MNEKNLDTIKIEQFTLGLSTAKICILSPILFIGWYLGYAFIAAVVWLTLAFIWTKKAHPSPMKLYSNIASGFILVNAKPDFFECLDNAIKHNKTVNFTCPKNPLLIIALNKFVEERLGRCTFENGEKLHVSFSERKGSCEILTSSDEKLLSWKVSVLLGRGWIIDGDVQITNGLFSKEFTQRMAMK